MFPLLLCVSCLHSRTSSATFTVSAGITIVSGKATLKINGEITENLYDYTDFSKRDANYYDNPLINKGTITKNEIKYLVAGEEYRFSVLPEEVVTINITSSDGKNVEIIARQSGREKRFTVQGTDRMGLFVAFQNH
jgi:hypothetical protein